MQAVYCKTFIDPLMINQQHLINNDVEITLSKLHVSFNFTSANMNASQYPIT